MPIFMIWLIYGEFPMIEKIPNKEGKKTEITPSTKVTGSVIYRMVPPEDRKKLKEIVKRNAKEMGLLVNIIEK